MMALRGSRAKKVLKFEAEKSRGFGHYAGRPEAEVIAVIDGLISGGVLRLEFHDGFPLLGYTDRGLELAMRFAAEEWLEVLRSRVEPTASGVALELPFLMSVMPQRNQNTVALLASLAGSAADRSWLPLLRAWQAVETRRVRDTLEPIILRLERTQTTGAG
jgi:hypothetical protein